MPTLTETTIADALQAALASGPPNPTFPTVINLVQPLIRGWLLADVSAVTLLAGYVVVCRRCTHIRTLPDILQQITSEEALAISVQRTIANT